MGGFRRPALLASLTGMSINRTGVAAVTASVALIVSGMAVATAPQAQAASGCSGSLIESRTLKVGKTTVGSMALYYNASTGMNCARTNHGGVTWNKKTYTLIEIYACKNTTPGRNCVLGKHAIDSGNYSKYAGPVSVYGKGKCIAVHANIWWKGDATVYSGGYPALFTTHCG